MEIIPYSLYLTSSHHDQPLLILGEIESLQLFSDVEFHVVFGFWAVVGVRPILQLFYFVEETTALAYVITLAHIFKCTTTCTFLRMASIHVNFGRGLKAQYQHCSS